jgi:hypothetical protein
MGSTAVAQSFLAVIPIRPEEDWLTDSVASREVPLHLASLIGLIALFLVTWIVFTEKPEARRGLPTTKVSRLSPRQSWPKP